MITFNDILKDNSIADVPIAHQQNIEELVKKVNILLEQYKKNVVVTSGYRSMNKHKDIYRAKGITNIPMGSKHLSGCAVDIYDPKGEFHSFLQNNPSILDKADLYCENRQGNWQHLQSKPFGSYRPGKTRWFNP
jgi:hypothetical protein